MFGFAFSFFRGLKVCLSVPQANDLKAIRTLRAPQGLTLVELLVVSLIFMIVSGVAFTIYRLNSSYYLSEEAGVIINQNLRNGLSAMARDVRMAGNGLDILGPEVKLVEFYTDSLEALDKKRPSVKPSTGWFSHLDASSSQMGVRAIYGVDGGAEFADMFTVFSAQIEFPAPIARVNEFRNGRLLLDSVFPKGVIKGGDIICLVNSNRAAILETQNVGELDSFLEIKTNGRFTQKGPPPGFPVEGAEVYNLRNVRVVTYFLDDKLNRLMAAFHDQSLTSFDDPKARAIVVSENIEDLQIYYFYQNDVVAHDKISDPVDIGSDRLQNNAVKAVFLGLTARSTYAKSSSQRRPALFNRLKGSVDEPLRRESLTEIVYLRNFQK
ncbi:MAG: prepilin-type N-terminal cleavage/methylation domain-containing protein [Deltaproteobacteria bacterium]|nr:prepilin-type N-terminal cleavage/methylation domain-containing protein [Deltaproteobacteria bacterium]